jgi:hypothetical protein
MVKHCALNILPKLAKLGFEIETSRDIALVPDAAFAPGMPKGDALKTLLVKYRKRKARQVAADAAAPRRPARQTSPLNIEQLLSRPLGTN